MQSHNGFLYESGIIKSNLSVALLSSNVYDNQLVIGCSGVGLTRFHAIKSMEILNNSFVVKDINNFQLHIDKNIFDFSEIEQFAKNGVKSDSPFILCLNQAKSIKIFDKEANSFSDELLVISKI